MSRSRIYVGTSGWNYRHWKGVIYPPEIPQSQWLHYISRQFDTLEINYSFYRIPTVPVVAKWNASVPSRLKFAAKMWRGITHYRKLLNCDEFLHNYFRVLDHLESHQRGPILVQLPPVQGQDIPRLEAFLHQLHHASSVRWKVAVEFRHNSWFSPAVYRMMDRMGAAVCLHDLSGSGATNEPNDASFVYIRRHGPQGEKYSGSYPEPMLQRDAEAMERYKNEGKTVFLYFNNDVGGHAVHIAKQLVAMLDRSTHKAA